ncbi:MAG TPA: biotin carboxylase N-terminal domain-containing protein [Acidimicrobiia bacterium]
MITRLLVANRGEIARRIFRTCRRLGVETVAIFSDVDRDEPHVVEADHAFHLPGLSAAETYLDIHRIIAIASESGANAIHPGYGFLAENAVFAETVVDAGLVWVGPTPESMRQMGSKIEAKALMAGAGVPILQGVDLSDLPPDEIQTHGNDIGYPLLVKASAGGGGKGMRIVDRPEDLLVAVEGASREAKSAFGDDTVFLEKYLTSPRHIEIQIIGDTHGEVVSLFERECSIQRRHQKIIEESPAVGLDEGIRRQMSEAAVAAGKTVGYVGAGTVEFVFEGGLFYFLEMNTRLQVEHAVTEMVTGLDLVEIQLRIAEGLPIPDGVHKAAITGHAVEARLYAEDPENDFLPVIGKVERFGFEERAGLRVDSGVESGSTISIHYDPMVAKVIAHGGTRADATRLLSESLRSARIHTTTTNRDLLVRVLEDREYLEGKIDTHFLERRGIAQLSRPLATEEDEMAAADACALTDQLAARQSARVLVTLPGGWRNQSSIPQRRGYAGKHGEYLISYRLDGDQVAFTGGETARIISLDPGHVAFARGDTTTEFEVSRYGGLRFVDGPGWASRLVTVPRFPPPEGLESTGSLHSPMPGKIIRIDVAVEDHVEEGDTLVVIEAMKMEHTIKAPYPGTIEAVMFTEGSQVVADAVLVVVRPD